MLSQAKEKLIRATHTKKGRVKSGLVLVEGKKNLAEAKTHVEWTFTESDTERFRSLVTTYTPQMTAGVARIPEWTANDLLKQPTILVLDHIQDPGNAGTILRLARGFNASLLLIDSVDLGNPKVIRSSAGAYFHVPWMTIKRTDAEEWIQKVERPVYRLEKRSGAMSVKEMTQAEKRIVIIGSEGSGIQLATEGKSVVVPHNKQLESLNVASATSILLYELNR